MSDPCVQAPSIARMETKLDKVLEALQEMARQKVQIETLLKGHEDHHSWLKNHENRLQQAEREPGKIAGKTLAILAGIGGSLLTGVLLYLILN